MRGTLRYNKINQQYSLQTHTHTYTHKREIITKSQILFTTPAILSQSVFNCCMIVRSIQPQKCSKTLPRAFAISIFFWRCYPHIPIERMKEKDRLGEGGTPNNLIRSLHAKENYSKLQNSSGNLPSPPLDNPHCLLRRCLRSTVTYLCVDE